MFFAIITLISALLLAGIAAWFAISGIMAIFAGAAIPAMMMGGAIELGKVVGASWLYRNWKEKTKIKWALLPSVGLAMLLTSMGIFGFLSKAHLQQTAPVGDNVAKIQQLDERIDRQNYKIKDAEAVIDQLDEAVNALNRNDRISGPNGSRAVRQSQQEQRAELKKDIEIAQAEIDKLQSERFEISQSVREMELDVGPVKYIAELIYGEGAQTYFDHAVRFVIIAFIFVFDPLAIVLLVAANYSLMRYVKKPSQNDSKQQSNANPENLINPTSDLSVELNAQGSQVSDSMSIEQIRSLINDIVTKQTPTVDDLIRREGLEQILRRQMIKKQTRTKHNQ